MRPHALFHAAARRHAPALRFPAGDRRRRLKSWAVPKGPTLDPAPKHFAAMVEDHPLDYGNFEGNIPAGNYGAGSVMLWDRGTFESARRHSPPSTQIERGDLKFRLHGEKS